MKWRLSNLALGRELRFVILAPDPGEVTAVEDQPIPVPQDSTHWLWGGLGFLLGGAVTAGAGWLLVKGSK